MSAQTDIIDTLNQWSAAELAADVNAIGGFLTEDFVGVGPLGFLLPRADWLDRHQSGALVYESFAIDDPQIRLYGDNAAVVIGHHTGHGAYRGHPIPEEARVTIVLVAEGPKWLLAGIQLSFVAGTPGAPPLPGRPPAGAGE